MFQYAVQFDQDSFDVRYHTLVKTVTRLELGGGTHPCIGTLGIDAQAGDGLLVRFEFCCVLNPGASFLNCGGNRE